MSQRSLRLLVLSGQIAGFKEANEWFVAEQDVRRITEHKAVEVSLEAANRKAATALVMAEQAYLRVQELMELLKLDHGGVPTDPDEARTWYIVLKSGKHQTAAIVADPEETMAWAKTFLAVTEHYLEWLETETGDDKSWAHVYMFARDLFEASTAIDAGTERLKRAHYYLKNGFNVVRSAVFFWLCKRNGTKYAAEFFPETKGSIDAGLIAILLERKEGEDTE